MIRFANTADKQEIVALWNICFPDDSGFNQYFFENLFDLRNVLLFQMDGRIAAMTQMIPYQMRNSAGKDEVFTYIYGACTHPEFRRRHLMSQLLEHSFQLDRSLGRAGSILIPAEPWLFDFYAQFDYQPTFLLSTETTETFTSDSDIPQLSMLSNSHIRQLNNLYESAFQPTEGHLARSQQVWKQQIEMFHAIGFGCVGLWGASGELCAYAFVWKPENGQVYAQELIARDDRSRDCMLRAIQAKTGAAQVKYSGPGETGQPLGCMKRYDDTVLTHAYMNLMLN